MSGKSDSYLLMAWRYICVSRSTGSLYESSSNNMLNKAGTDTILFLASSIQDSQAEMGTSRAVLYWALIIGKNDKTLDYACIETGPEHFIQDSDISLVSREDNDWFPLKRIPALCCQMMKVSQLFGCSIYRRPKGRAVLGPEANRCCSPELKTKTTK